MSELLTNLSSENESFSDLSGDVSEFFSVLIEGAKNGKFLKNHNFESLTKCFSDNMRKKLAEFLSKNANSRDIEETYVIRKLVNKEYNDAWKPPEFYAFVNEKIYMSVLTFADTCKIVPHDKIQEFYNEYCEIYRKSQNYKNESDQFV